MRVTVCESFSEFFDAGAGAIFQATDVTDPENPRPVWHTTPPCGHRGVLAMPGDREDGKFHTVTQNPDGTITVDPSIWCQGEDGKTPCWHGHIRNGVWESV